MMEMTMMTVQANNGQMVCWKRALQSSFLNCRSMKVASVNMDVREMIILLISAIALSQSYIGIKVFYAGSSDISTITDLL